jgi:hypothetical protein
MEDTMAKRAHTNGSEAKGKYIVEINYGEEKGGIKRITFRKAEAALKLTKLLNKKKPKARVLDSNGQEIYPCG